MGDRDISHLISSIPRSTCIAGLDWTGGAGACAASTPADATASATALITIRCFISKNPCSPAPLKGRPTNLDLTP